MLQDESDIDLISRKFELKKLKKRAEEMLVSESADGHTYTKDQVSRKQVNLKNNFEKLLDLSKAGDMEEFQKWLHMLKTPKDLYFEDYELIHQQWELEEFKKARSQEFFAEEHQKFMDKIEADKEEFEQLKQAREERREEKRVKAEEAKEKKDEEDADKKTT